MKDNYQTCLILSVGSNDFSWEIFIFMLYFNWISLFGGYTWNISCIKHMAQAHETGTSQVGGPKLAKVFYGRIV